MNLEYMMFFVFIFVIGTIFGSFASVVLWRLKTGESGMATGRSRCPHCKKTLRSIDLVPLFSYCLLRGKCHFCRKPISAIYPILEFSFGILLLLFVGRFVPITLLLQGDLFSITSLLFWWVITFVIIAFVFYDILFMEVPLEILIPAMIALTALLFGSSLNIMPNLFQYFLWFENSSLLNIPLLNATTGAIIIFVFFYGQYRLSGGKWIGGGDVYIGIFMGLLGGFKLSLLGLFLSYIIGSIIGTILMIMGKREMSSRIPFWPSLGLGLCISILYHEPILGWYLSFLG